MSRKKISLFDRAFTKGAYCEPGKPAELTEAEAQVLEQAIRRHREGGCVERGDFQSCRMKGGYLRDKPEAREQVDRLKQTILAGHYSGGGGIPVPPELAREPIPVEPVKPS